MGTLDLTLTGQVLPLAEIPIPPAPYARVVSSLSAYCEVGPVGADLIFQVQDITGGAPLSTLAASIAAGTKVTAAPYIGACLIPANQTGVLRIIAGPTGGSAASYLHASLEISSSIPTTNGLLSLADLKSAENIVGSATDAELLAICAAVTAQIQKFTGRTLVAADWTLEEHEIHVTSRRLVLREKPVLSAGAQIYTGTPASLAAVTGFELDRANAIATLRSGFCAGLSYFVTYSSGYSPIPSDLQQAALDQARTMWKDHGKGKDRFGASAKATDGGGSATYVVGGWHPRARAIAETYRRRLA